MATLTELARTVPIRSTWRWPAVLMLLATAATHIPLISDHLEEAPYVGVLFIALSVVSLVLAVVVVVADTPLVWLATGVVGFLSVVAFLASRTVGLPQIGDDVGNWSEPLGFPAVAAEALAALFAFLVLSRDPATHAHRATSRATSREIVR